MGHIDSDIETLYRHMLPELRAMLVRRLGNASEAEEVAHDAFERIYSLDDRSHIDHVRGYVFTAANRLALNVLRRRQVESAYISQNAGTVARAEDAMGPERIALGDERLELAWGAIAALPEKTRHIFLLHRFDGRTYSQIAAEVGLTTKSIEYHMKRAMLAVGTALSSNGRARP